MKRNQKLQWYVFICKRYLMDILDRIDAAKNEMERAYYTERYAVALSDFSNAGALHKRTLNKCVRSEHLCRPNIWLS